MRRISGFGPARTPQKSQTLGSVAFGYVGYSVRQTGIFVYLYIELMCLINTIYTSKTHHFEYELKHL